MSRSGATAISIQGEWLTLLPERAVYHERRRTLYIADPHFGKIATFRAHAITLPEGSHQADLARLSQALARTGADRLIILGDLLHTAKSREAATVDTFTTWRSRHEATELVLIRGNHDKHAGDPPEAWQVRVIDGPAAETSFVLNHIPFLPETGYTLAGHVHPAVLVAGKAKQRLKLPCFWFGAKCGVLPAFGSFIDHGIIRPEAADQVFVIAGSQVLKMKL